MRVVRCPECDCRVEVDPDMEGRRVACPECDERFVVPPRSRRDDGDDTPRPRRKRRKAAGGPNWTLIGGLAVGLLVLTVGGVVAYKATRPKPAPVADASEKAPAGEPQPAEGSVVPFAIPPVEPQLPPPPPPPGWVRFTDPDTGVSADMPADPGRPSGGTGELLRTRVTDRDYLYSPPGGGMYRLVIMIFPADAVVQPDERQAVLRLPRHQLERNGRGRFVAERATTLAGVPATEQEFVMPDNATHAARFAFVRSGGKQLFVHAVVGGPKVTAADRQAFLNSIRPAGR